MILRAMFSDTHPARVGLNLAFTSKIGASDDGPVSGLRPGKVCPLLLLQFAVGREVHGPEMPWETAILEPPYKAGYRDAPQSKLWSLVP